MSRERILQHFQTNLDLIFETTLQFDKEILDEVNNFDLENQKWLISGYRPGSEDSFFNGRIKILPCYESENWKFAFAKNIFYQILDAFKIIDPNYNLREIIRCNLNYCINDGSMTDADIHQDSININHWSFLVYLSGKTGDTDFVNSLAHGQVIKTISYEKGKLILFPSIFPHQGHLPVDHFPRLTLNYILELDTELSKQILENSPSSIKKYFKEDQYEPGRFKQV